MAKTKVQALRDAFQQAHEFHAGTACNATFHFEGDLYTTFGGASSLPGGPFDVRGQRLGEITIDAPDGRIEVKQVAIESMSSEQLADLVQLSRDGAMLLPKREQKRWGVSHNDGHADTTLEACWLTCVYRFIREADSRFVESRDSESIMYGRTTFDVLKRPLLASVRFIDACLLTDDQRKRKRPDRKMANAAVRKQLAKNPSQSIRQIAKATGYSSSMIGTLPVWIANMEARRKEQAAKRPTAVRLTEPLADHHAHKAAELKEVIDAQKADYEPSPLSPRGRNPIIHPKV